MTGPALYYRIESPRSQRATATWLTSHRGLEDEHIQRHSGVEAATNTNFPRVALRGSVHDTILVLPIGEQVFEAESETYGEYRIWQRGQGSTTEILVWTNF